MSDGCDINESLLQGISTDGSPYHLALQSKIDYRALISWCSVHHNSKPLYLVSQKAPFLFSLFPACITMSIIVFITSTITNNVSQVDKLWSIIPFVYTWMPVCDGRTFVMAFLATVWGIRLTWNFNRRGGYSWPPWSGEEDYRWEQIRQGHYLRIFQNPVVWHVFNFVFISVYQNFLLLLIVTPSFLAYSLATNVGCEKIYVPLNAVDYLLAILVLFFIIVESIADNQQFAFQTEKYRRINAGIELDRDYKDGFNQTGLFSILRKPNYAAEQSIWITFYFFTVNASGGKLIFNWTMLGWLLLVLLFQGSGKLI